MSRVLICRRSTCFVSWVELRGNFGTRPRVDKLLAGARFSASLSDPLQSDDSDTTLRFAASFFGSFLERKRWFWGAIFELPAVAIDVVGVLVLRKEGITA